MSRTNRTNASPNRRAAFAPKSSLRPDPQAVARALGRDSLAFRRASARLTALWLRLRRAPAIALKRRLWAQLLTLVYGREIDSDALWIQHAYLVVVAKAVALAVLDLHEDDPRRLLSGETLAAAGISGAVESDVFDWIAADPEGEDLVRWIVTRVRRFRLREVQCDVLKALYESLVDRAERHGLGEYYTPDWLAAKVVRRTVDRPLEQRVLDPACGSGAFLFHAVRAFLAEADAAGMPLSRQASEAAAHVSGMDIHPVAAIIARVTYLLALAPVLSGRAGALTIPVWPGDALQLPNSPPPGCADLAADVLIGNPPWIAYRHMSPGLQKQFKALASAEGVYVGGKQAPHNDLCALFVARTAALYLRASGRIGFVLPYAVLTRGQFAKLRTGEFASTRIAFDEVWTLDDGVSPLFPAPACVVLGRKRAAAAPIPPTARAFRGTLPFRDAPEAVADACLTTEDRAPAPCGAAPDGCSPYLPAFRQGATLVPRMLCLVERKPPLAVSRRKPNEKEPWKSAPGVERRVEASFIRPVLLGESILPFRVFRPCEGIAPIDGDGAALDARAAAARGYPGLAAWMGAAEKIWSAHARSPMSLVERWNYHNELGAQFPVAPLRIVYAKAGTLPAAAVVQDGRAVIDHMLYWMAIATEAEGHYLAAILNSEAARLRIEALQAVGQFGPRHFDKLMLTLPIPRFDGGDGLHLQLADCGAEARKAAASVAIDEDAQFQRARRRVRQTLSEAGLSEQINVLVEKLLTPR